MRFGWVLLGVILVWACEPLSPWEGRYEGGGLPAMPVVALTLQPGGKGGWSVEQETTPVRWEERDGSLWLHLKSGGVIALRPVPGEKSLVVELPGVGSIKLLRK